MRDRASEEVAVDDEECTSGPPEWWWNEGAIGSNWEGRRSKFNVGNSSSSPSSAVGLGTGVVFDPIFVGFDDGAPDVGERSSGDALPSGLRPAFETSIEVGFVPTPPGPELAAANGFGFVNLGLPAPVAIEAEPVNVGTGCSLSVWSAGTGLRNDVRDLEDPVGDDRGEVGTAVDVDKELSGVTGRRAGGVDGAVRNDAAESFEKCWSDDGLGGFFGRLYCFGEGIVSSDMKECGAGWACESSWPSCRRPSTIQMPRVGASSTSTQTKQCRTGGKARQGRGGGERERARSTGD